MIQNLKFDLNYIFLGVHSGEMSYELFKNYKITYFISKN